MKYSLHTDNKNIVAAVYKSSYDNLKHYFMSYTHDAMAAEDMLQDLFMKLLSLDVISEETALNLVFVMAKRMIVDAARHKSFIRKQEKDIAHTLSYYEDSVARKVEYDELVCMERTFLNQMPAKRAHVYSLYRHDALSADEIALKLGISKRTVEAHIYLSTKEMRRKMESVI